MEKYFGEKQQRFSFRKLSVGLVSATISSLFFMSVLGSSSVEAQETKGVHYKYVTESELSSDEKKQLVYDIPTCMENDDETYYLVYKLNSQNQLGELPNTGSKNDMKTLVAGASLAALGILIFAVSKKKVKNKTVLHLVLVAGIGNGVLVSAHALENNLLLNYNTDYELTTGEKLPLPKEISGYTYIGYIKERNITSESKVNNQEKSVATSKNQQKVDYTIAPNFIEGPSKIQVINGQYETVPEFRDGQVGAVATESAATKADALSSDMNSEVESHSTPPTVDSSQNGENLGKQGEDATPVEKPKEQEPEKTEEVPVNPTEGTTEGTSNQGAENPVQPAEESTTNSEKVSPDTSNENTGEVSSNPSDSKPPVEETNKPEKDESKDETSIKPENSGNATTESGQTEPDQPKGNSPEDVSTESKTSNSNESEEIKHKTEVEPDKKVEDQEKTIELRSVSDVELYSYEGNQSKQHTSLDKVPDNKSAYFIKVKSAKFKDVLLPVSNIEDTTKDGKAVYKITARLEHLKQSVDNQYQDNFTYYLPKVVQNDGSIYTSFKKLVTDMNSRPNGTFTLGATMNAREVELPDDQESYVKNEFYGKLIGENNGKYYAIYNLKKPLFKTLNTATIQNLSIKEANVSSKEDAATISKEAKYNTLIDNVHSDGIIAGERGIGGLVSKVDNSRISNSSFTGRITNTYDTTVGYEIGGLVGKLSGSLASIEKSIASIDIASNAKSGDQIVGGIAGVVEKSATIKYSYVEGNVNNVRHFGKVGGVAGNLWDRDSQDVSKSGKLSYVLSDVNVTNGNAISGDNFDNMKEDHAYSSKGNKVVNVVQVDDELVTKDSDVQRGTVLDADKVKEKKAELVSKHSTKVEDFDFTSRYTTIYNEVTGYQKSREQVYKNIEKLLPFYNRETIVKYGNLVDESSELFTKELLSVVPMKNNEVITDINKNKQEINKLLLHFEGNKSQVLNIAYKNDFSKVAEYSIEYQGLLYTPNTLLHDYSNIVDNVLTDLNSVQYDSNAIKKILDISDKVKNTELYLDEQFVKTKANIKDTLSKLLSADAAIAENSNSIIDNYVIQKIKQNKEALLLGLTYLERWYNFKYGETKAKDLVMYHLDFFGKSNSSALDNVIQLGKSGFNNLLAKNNVITYNVLLSKNYGTESLFKALEGYRKVFLPTTSNNEWFKAQTKAYIVEEKSSIPEVSKKQSEQGTKYSIGIYDRLTSPSWKYQSMVLPLLTLPEEKTVFMIANISTIGFGAYDRYRSKVHPKGDNLNKFVEDNVREAAKRFRDHYDYWYKILEPENREKLYRSLLVYDAFKFGRDNTEDKVTYQADFETDHPAIKYFFGPAGNNVVHNGHGAYATGDAFYYMAYRMLDKDGAVTYTHEMTHNSDREIYLGGYGRRSGLGPEFYAKGLLQAPDHPYDPTITINSVLKYDDSENSTRLQVADPTQRFNSAEDLHNYMHNMFDLIYTLEILEGRAVAKLDYNAKNDLLRKIENKYKQDPDGNSVYATNVVRRLTMDEVNKLNSFDSLIENDIITSRGYKDQEYKRNGYYTIDLFSPIYSALSGEKGTPGDLMGRRIAFELLAAKGYKEGMVPYISNQYEKDAKAAGSKIKSYGKEVGLVTDKLVLEKVFNNRYSSWVEFKKAMYNERIAKFNNLISVSFNNPNVSWGRTNRITITSIANLQNMINTAVNEDAEDFRAQLYPDTNSRVLKLKKAIYKAYLDQTNDFRSSIFENKK
ncbi:ZmpA/ZmpB/ZmpC family metallo-endopeptidase [Streptococcus pneumoniae]|uniref:YSIRK signal domain/LPXTG anchor domain surface protein n=1 Tax=Streptococcus pneumoniae TaxID=1313 RepID=UPI0005E512A3|nr:YSIRK signal domain/LPXTG anchor domain surface protein [Streptococcus pneumoniae]CIO16373.1 immunoglobulin A1 protease [Streptococcus pneumoniae]CIS88756.1 immunoglobulin A1 protease [Streptococcus pneumoniae]CIW58055.1 immunoglobulin A1 protease [Streptococcus pneumoniae]CON74217.1 immunoglobulin A1 protease [Streptococcus pneumoniae]